jgi:hypothetical protein
MERIRMASSFTLTIYPEETIKVRERLLKVRDSIFLMLKQPIKKEGGCAYSAMVLHKSLSF